MMAGDIERLLISSVLKERDLKPALEAKILPDFFLDEDGQEIWTWVLDYYGEYSEVPTAKAMKREFPHYGLIKPTEPHQYYVDTMRKARRFALTGDALAEAAAALDEGDTETAIKLMGAGLIRVGVETSGLRDTNLIETWEARLERYDAWSELPDGMRGIPTGFPTLDKATLGLQAEQLVTFIGMPKAGKSTLMMFSAITAHEYGKAPLFISFEMSNEEQEARHDAMRAKISYPRLLSGKMTPEERKTLEATMRRMRSHDNPFLLSADISSATTVSGLAAKVEQYRPDVLFVDGVYLMDDENGEPKGSPQALTNLTRSLKRLAQKQRIPVVCSTQVLGWKTTRKRGITQDSIGYSSSFAQDSDLIVGLEHISEEDDDQDLRKLKIVAARSSKREECIVRWDWERGDFEERDGATGEEVGDDAEW